MRVIRLISTRHSDIVYLYLEWMFIDIDFSEI